MQGLGITQQQINSQSWFKSFQWNIATPESQAETGLPESRHIQLLIYSETRHAVEHNRREYNPQTQTHMRSKGTFT
jgi:hypothetical protein